MYAKCENAGGYSVKLFTFSIFQMAAKNITKKTKNKKQNNFIIKGVFKLK